ncbi:MAG: tRNA (N6-isopentenyl adenosine(37)-C2)-methylthiotransferase MiaB [Candidatus Edwardsbacteria bacterium RIFOXYD12_FULL_50_11]|uniref:tRNA-2-methylthio-N(6)-dimethylallyladenosine synthase n=1 Tax=Candidatus Edwardsbacteria bacterium GWF2_54_11 TaxID=1817851 RepID=A0A1F5R449_9BACT|nr:MAG: tRNA (N6-isopentenyl adenosine(37)-C2)-methylthiotransferase MiaB [Candidatus Edwardsbacteria bacterium RifOxyC12_full_54_24]OGF08349.1 MAG: tRNA (N6-isopentenyl adenosine(37)-C2)-methylthiotransferase MiaB [Candidatus Edwardsbacteria bacterium RifOxyA12_full_54_48]OGF09238.1 MAG: tRNA (N6-isopentenyl adenosine(37)-C2)-methylthiotransferase MiaB [Candidatus Edwardsbacteria bacterium GWF2_54_11]OGF11647.1 MAG: tRNA (N6-isopentenyl adenosine(37)-C2)-methylthiotransferase MiaB [Candidatus E
MLNLIYYMETYGCQMNLYDSAAVRTLLDQAGCRETEDPEQAQLVVINSCAVRGHAEERVLGRVGELKSWKRRSPGRLMILMGCVGQENGQNLLDRFRQLDLVLGTERYREIVPHLQSLLKTGARAAITGLEKAGPDLSIIPRFEKQVGAFLAVMRGCDNFCSYCIVPYVRGREYSRTSGDILGEIKCLAERGIKEITLVGQNVNSYLSAGTDFPGLLAQAADVPGLERLRFITSHPKDCGIKLLETMAGNQKICRHLHLPLQSGSDRVLAQMNRKYTLGQYREIVSTARKLMPDLVLTSDLIAGFPGESEEDFKMTLDVMQDIRFDSAFTYKYSIRPGTKAAQMPGQLAEDVRQDRLARMISLQQKISQESNQADIGKTFIVLVEKAVPKRGQMMGRSPGNKPVAFDCASGVSPGDIVKVTVNKATQSTLTGSRRNCP